MWLKADNGALNNGNPAESGDDVTIWEDLSGARSNNATNNDEISAPIYHHDSTNHMNYNPTLNFDGTGSGLNFGSDYVFPDGGIIDLGIVLGSALGFKSFKGMTFFTVQKPMSTDPNKNLQFIYDIGSYDLDGFGSVYNHNSSMFYSPEGTVGTVITGTLNSLFDILIWILGSSNVSNTNTSGLVSHSYGNNQSISRTSVVTGADILGVLLGGAAKSANINGSNYYSASNFSLIQLNLNSILGASEHYGYSGPFTIGRQSRDTAFYNNNTRAFEGQIAEVIGYTGVLTDAETNRIESYLALKYGITLNFGGTENGNYTSSDGSTIWDASTATAIYQNDIIGIARDDNSGLLQKQSHTQDDSVRIYLSNLDSTNSANQGNFPNDKAFVIVGSNGDNLYSSSSFSEKPPGLYSRIDREWRIQTNNFSDSFSLDITLNSFATANGVDPSDLYVLVDSDGDFTNATCFNSTDGIDFSVSGNTLTVAGLDTSIIPNNSTNFFTVGSGSGNTPLPVSFKDFYLNENQESNIEISWETYTEKNNDYFTVYHSTDGVNWKTVQKIKSKGYSENLTFYSILDKTPEEGINFYKLEQTDLNGENTELAIDEIEVTNEINGLMAYPTPTIDKLHIKGEITISEKSVLINAGGIILPLPEITKVKDGHYILDLSHLSKGVYLLQTEKGTIRILKK